MLELAFLPFKPLIVLLVLEEIIKQLKFQE
jgi:hypothetical protein